MAWKKSSLCRADEPMCAEVDTSDGDFVLARDDFGHVVMFTHSQWEAFIGGVKLGEFDLPN